MNKRLNNWFLISAGVLFGVFLLNIFLGKAALSSGTEPILSLGDVGEFLVLLAAVICFIIEVLRREAKQSAVETNSSSGTVEESN